MFDKVRQSAPSAGNSKILLSCLPQDDIWKKRHLAYVPQIAATLREHAGAVARLQARVDDVSTLLLGGTRGGHPDVRRSAPLPSGLLAGPEVDEKRVVERVGANSTVGQTVSDLDRLQELKSSATMEVKTSLLGEVQAGKAEAAAGAVGFGQPAASSAERSRASWLSAEESSRPSGLQRGPQALLVLESPRRGVRTSGTGHVRFSEPCELLKESLDANGGTSRNPKAPSETASDVSFVESFWADSAQANSPPVPGRSSEVGSSKDTSLASIMHKFDAGSFGGSPRAEQGERLLTEKRLQSDAIKRHVDAIGDGWGFAGKDEGSAYARALAKTEERKRRLDKVRCL